MKILMLNPFYYPYRGGTEKHIREISKLLVKNGHSITILCAKQKGTKENEMFEGVHIVRVSSKIFNWLPHPLPPPYPLMFGFERKYKELLKEKFDIVHIHNRFVFGPGIVKLAKESGAKVVLTIHNSRTENIDFITDLFGKLYDDLIGKKVIIGCDGVMGVSHWALDRTVPKEYKGIIKAVYNGYDPNEYNENVPRGAYWKEFFKKFGLRGKMILTNARLVRQKGLKYLIKSIVYIRGAYLVILGRGPLENELRALSYKLNVPVYFLTDVLPEDSLSELYSSSYLFVLSSLYEPCGLVLLEAQAMGVPVVATDAGGDIEIFKNGETGFLVPLRNPKAIAEKVNALISNKQLYEKLSSNAKKFALNFTWEKTYKKVERFYYKLFDL